jgi:hypothetical protein
MVEVGTRKEAGMESTRIVIQVGGHLPALWSSLLAVAPAYVGPDQVMPLGSVLAALVGLLLMGGHRVAAFLRKVRDAITRR